MSVPDSVTEIVLGSDGLDIIDGLDGSGVGDSDTGNETTSILASTAEHAATAEAARAKLVCCWTSTSSLASSTKLIIRGHLCLVCTAGFGSAVDAGGT